MLLPTTRAEGRAQPLLALWTEGSGVPTFMDASHKQSRASTGRHARGSCGFQFLTWKCLTLPMRTKKTHNLEPPGCGIPTANLFGIPICILTTMLFSIMSFSCSHCNCKAALNYCLLSLYQRPSADPGPVVLPQRDLCLLRHNAVA